MERDGLITRTVSTTDRRRFDVSLTPPGRLRFDQAWPAHADGIGRYFAQPLTSRDIGDLTRILDALIQANQNHHQPG
jgi:DNA-binding MarR family transcriptional regulator